MANNIYTFNKTTFIRTLYGEIQSEYNMSLVCDGTKDSCKIVVLNNERKEIDPITIVYLEDTKTWWIVNSDKVRRYKNEIGGFYEHTISLVGAFEILSYRDMINCGFNANRYTYTQFFTRLATMFDFELPITWNIGTYVDMGQKVSYLKTFQNYSPSSAIKEMFNGLNLVPKLTFTTTTSGGTTRITGATISAISKSGTNQTILNGENIFLNEEENSSSNADSFGSRVVSNVENCVSGEVVRFPNYGGTKLVSDEPTVDVLNGFLRLPSNIYEVKKLTQYGIITNTDAFQRALTFDNFYIVDITKEELLNKLKTIYANFSVDRMEKSFYENNIYERLVASSMITFENGGDWDQIYNVYNSKTILMDADVGAPTNRLWLNDKNHGTTSVFKTWNCIYWEQGKDKIENFDWMNGSHRMRRKSGQEDTIELTWTNQFGQDERTHTFTIEYDINSKFSVIYIPMGDLKVKVDNNIEQNDSNLYNQNGKLIDAKSVSKLINSYAREISSNEISRSAVYYKYSDIPQVGSLVNLYGDIYIINNVSMDFYENEFERNNFGTIKGDHYIVATFTMTKNVACKSTMISANTNIRDYQCPQQNNVPRIQTYRDYFELGYTNQETHEGTHYIYYLTDIFNFGDFSKGLYKNYSTFFSSNFLLDNINNTFYYNIGTTKYNLNKQTIIVADFKDNNIIGYEAGSSYYTLQLSKWIDNLTNKKYVNTPISYVNEFGEISQLNLRFVDESKLSNIYGDNLKFFGKSFSIPIDIWNNVNATSVSSISIDETSYNKDGLEVPVFEYCCEVGDNNGIVFGENFLKGEKVENYITNENWMFYYTITRFPSNEIITQENITKYRNAIDGAYGVVDDPVDIEYDNTNRLLKVYIDGEDIESGDNFVINMICCYKDLELSHGWYMEESLFGINKFNNLTTHQVGYFLKYKYHIDSISANSTETIQIPLGHRNVSTNINYVNVISDNQNVTVTNTTYEQINKCYYANVSVRNNSEYDQHYKLTFTISRKGNMFALKVNNWKLK